MVRGYVGKPKGIKQILWERGLWKAGMSMSKTEKEVNRLRADGKPAPDPVLYADRVLARCPDFLLEKSKLEDLVESRGHILLVGVKCHPEMAGMGVEYVFGCSKKHFRKHNDCITTHLHANVRASLAPDVVTRERVWKYERRAWTYQQLYRELGDGREVTYPELELLVKERKNTHRNVLELERAFMQEVEEGQAAGGDADEGWGH